MRSKGFGLMAAVGGVLLFAAAGTPAHATFWCKGGTHGFGAARTAAAAPAVAPAARKHAWIGKRHAWRSGRAYGYAAAPVRGYRYGYGPRYGYRAGVAWGARVGDRDPRFRFRDRDRRYGFRDRDDRRYGFRDRDRRADVRVRAGAEGRAAARADGGTQRERGEGGR
jgi:hypothetical protein